MTEPENQSTPVLELEDIDVPSPSDPDEILVRSLNWRVSRGDRWLVTGPPGSGKSSAVQVAAGLVRPAHGRLLLFGSDVAELGEAEQVALRARVGVVFSGAGRLFSHISVEENLALPLLYHSTAGKADDAPLDRLGCVLEGLGLESYATRMPRELPRRIAARVALARALMLSPEVLLLDDPAGGLASEEVQWWREFLTSCTSGSSPIANLPQTVMIAAQNVTQWQDLADHFVRVDEGTWQVDGDKNGGASEPGLRPAGSKG